MATGPCHGELSGNILLTKKWCPPWEGRTHSARFQHATQNSVQFKTYEFFISGIFHLVFQTQQIAGNQSRGMWHQEKGRLLFCLSFFFLKKDFVSCLFVFCVQVSFRLLISLPQLPVCWECNWTLRRLKLFLLWLFFASGVFVLVFFFSPMCVHTEYVHVCVCALVLTCTCTHRNQRGCTASCSSILSLESGSPAKPWAGLAPAMLLSLTPQHCGYRCQCSHIDMGPAVRSSQVCSEHT